MADKRGRPAENGQEDAELGSDLAVIREQTRESLELLRALVGLLVCSPSAPMAQI
jgi:hypothetical protein